MISQSYFNFSEKFPRVWYPDESLMTPGSQLPILELFAQAFKGTVSQQ